MIYCVFIASKISSDIINDYLSDTICYGFKSALNSCKTQPIVNSSLIPLLFKVCFANYRSKSSVMICVQTRFSPGFCGKTPQPFPSDLPFEFWTHGEFFFYNLRMLLTSDKGHPILPLSSIKFTFLINVLNQ